MSGGEAIIFMQLKGETTTSPVEVAGKVAKMKGVSEVMLVSGEWHVMVKFKYEKLEDLSKFVVSGLGGIQAVGRTNTLMVLQNLK